MDILLERLVGVLKLNGLFPKVNGYFRLDFQPLAQAELVNNNSRKIAKRIKLVLTQLSRFGVYRAERSETNVIPQDQRCARIESHTKLAGYQGIVDESRIIESIRHHHDLVVVDGVATKRAFSRTLGEVPTSDGLEPLPVTFNESDEENWSVDYV